MKKKGIWKNILLWTLSLLFTISFAVYQRMTGPTYPIKGKIDVNGSEISFKLLRTWGGSDDALISIKVPKEIEGFVEWRRYKSHDEWTKMPMIRKGEFIEFGIPHQPPAGKVMYNITLTKSDKQYALQQEPTVIRFKGYVPSWIVILHVFFIFGAMLLSTRTGIEALTRGSKAYGLAIITVVFWIMGGFVFGPIMQKYAFGAFWTGWPFGHDLTDNKSLVALIFWILALVKLHRNRQNRWAPILAVIMMIVVFLIPHSVLGSEIDHTAKTQIKN